MIKYSISLLLLIGLFSCKNETLPKPKAMLRLEYPQPNFIVLENDCSYGFEFNQLASIKRREDCQIEVEYPSLKATIHITYKEVKNNIESLLRDAQNLTYDHNVKADGIITQPYINEDFKKFGRFYEVTGNAASQAQFYITDSTKHFLTGSLYFNVKPNYDSILPAADYLKGDMRRIMESLRWK